MHRWWCLPSTFTFTGWWAAFERGHRMHGCARVTGGVGERSPAVRRRSVEQLGHLGLALDIPSNNAIHKDGDITAAGATKCSLVIIAREDLWIAGERQLARVSGRR